MKRQFKLFLFFLVSVVTMSTAFADVLLNYVPPGQVWGPGSSATHACKKYQGVTEDQYAIKYVALENWRVTSASYYAFEQGDYGAPFWVYMNVVHVGTNPSNGTLLATSSNVDANTWGTTPAFHPFAFPSSFQMVAGDTYWFVIRAHSSISSTDCGVGSHLRSWVTIENNDVKTDSYYSLDTGATWPLATPRSSLSVTQGFGVNWAGGNCSTDNSVIEKHNGVDYSASYNTAVMAAEAGVVKQSYLNAPWGYNIVIEHTTPSGLKYTTVYWHIQPSVSVGDSVTKGQTIATVANLGGNTHFHFGARAGANIVRSSDTGALPVVACGTHPAFPDGFVDPESTDYIHFQ